MFRRSHKPCSVRRQLNIESLEDRQLLTTTLDSLAINYSNNAHQVAQNSIGEALYLLDWTSQEVTRVGPAKFGSVELTETGTVSFVPQANFLGVDSFEFTTIDWDGTAKTQTAFVNVTESVYALPDWMRVEPGVETTIEVLANDYNYQTRDYQSQFNQLTITAVSRTSNGQVAISEDGSTLTYTPQADFQGLDEVAYTVLDSYGNESTATAVIEVTPDFDRNTFSSYEHFFTEALAVQVDRWHYYFGSANNVYPRCCDLFTLTDTSLRNLQVEGVDEGDIVKRAGDDLFLASGENLRIVDVSDAANPLLVNELSFAAPLVDLYSFDERLTVITEPENFGDQVLVRPLSYEPMPSTSFTVHVLDIADPLDPELVYSTHVDGDYRDSRFIKGHLYTVANHDVSLSFGGPQTVGEGDAQFQETISQYVERMRKETPMLAGYEVNDASGTVTKELFDWQDIPRPTLESYNGFASVVTFDTTGIDGTPTDAEMANLEHGFFDVYVSTEAIYLMSQTTLDDVDNLPPGLVLDWGWSGDATRIQKFEFESDGSGVEWAAEGQVTGQLSDQFSADEHNDHFRIATTSGWGGEVSLFVMSQTDDVLEVIGSVENIAPGERIYSTRFDGDRAFVTTYRKVDPLFVIDLSDPTTPTIEGALKIPSYSNYMQVINENYVLGIGRDANGGLYDGLQVSLFDVSDASDPQLVAKYEFEGGRNTWSTVANAWNLLDHQAVTFVAEDGILAIPTHTSEQWGGGSLEGTDETISVLKIDIEQQTIELIGEMEFDDRAHRSVHVDGYLYGVSDSTVQVSELLTPDTVVSTLDLTGGEATPVAELPFTFSPTDFNGDGVTAPADLVYIYAMVREYGYGDMKDQMESMIDVDRNGQFSPHDVLAVINALEHEAEALTETPAKHQIGSRQVAEVGEMGPFQESEPLQQTESEQTEPVPILAQTSVAAPDFMGPLTVSEWVSQASVDAVPVRSAIANLPTIAPTTLVTSGPESLRDVAKAEDTSPLDEVFSQLADSSLAMLP